MTDSRLNYVTKRPNVVIYTEHPDRIHPRDLSNYLSARYGENSFKISLRRNIYIIYIDAQGEEDDSDSDVDLEGGRPTQIRNNGTEDYKLRLADIKLAEETLKRARLSKI